jgi:hypothetical protein
MNSLRQFIGRIRLQLRRKNQVVGWKMTPAEARGFFSAQGKTVLTLLGFSGSYESENALLQTVREILLGYTPEKTLVNIGGNGRGDRSGISRGKIPQVYHHRDRFHEGPG